VKLKVITDSKNKTKSPDTLDVEIIDNSIENAITLYRKVREGKNKELTEKQIADIDKECEIIRNRDVITKDLQHKPVEITSNDGLIIGPPTLLGLKKPELWAHVHFNYLLALPYSLKFQKTQLHHLK